MSLCFVAPCAFGDDYAAPAAFQSPVHEDPTANRSAPNYPTSTSSPSDGFSLSAASAASQQDPGPSPAQPLDTAPRVASAPAGPLPTGGAPLPITQRDRPKPLAASDSTNGEANAGSTAARGIDTLLTVVGSLGIVLGLFMVVMWCLRRGMPKGARPLPSEVVEVLGRAPLAGRQQMHLIRFGSKLVLAAVSPNGVDPISEITDPVEADRLAGYCEQTRSSSATASFRNILDRLDERSGRDDDEPPRRPNRGLASLVGLKGSRAEDEYV